MINSTKFVISDPGSSEGGSGIQAGDDDGDECPDIAELLDACKKTVGNQNRMWERSKKLGNPYECVGSLASVCEPVVSRAFFKLWEIIMDFDIIRKEHEGTRSMRTLSVAEGPGGFVQCICHYRKRFHADVAAGDAYTGFTLRSFDSGTPGWNIPTKHMEAEKVSIVYGSDNTGNLYSAANIRGLSKMFPHTVDLFTADGGFDFSVDDHNQESTCIRLLCAQVLACLETQAEGGTAVIKMFDARTSSTRRVLLALVRNFGSVVAVKPHTSRIGNSERYLVCRRYHGKRSASERKLLWKCIFYNPSTHLESPQQIEQMSGSYLSTVRKMNTCFMAAQLTSLANLLSICNWRDDKSESIFTDMQRVLASAWCKKYKLDTVGDKNN